ncbi:hypothetical protein XH88_10520 [Bradyrhizobium sp. CCBAU 51627]|nr:hypothetical protein [Bradyrhizobium sp. CCBAU 51627]
MLPLSREGGAFFGGDVEEQRLWGQGGPSVVPAAPAKQDGIVGKACHAVVALCKTTQTPESRIILTEQPLVVAAQHAMDRAFTEIGQLLLKLG